MELLETPRGREEFFEYLISEAAVWDFVSEVERTMQAAAIDLEARRRQIAEDKLSATDRAKRFFNNAKPEFVTAIVGKINDLVGRFLPGGKSEKRKA